MEKVPTQATALGKTANCWPNQENHESKYSIVSPHPHHFLASNDSFIQIQLEEGRRADWYSLWQGSSPVESCEEGDGRKDGRNPGRQLTLSVGDSPL